MIIISKIVTVAVLGAGNRGREVYGQYIIEHPGDVKVVAVAEPDERKRGLFVKEHGISKVAQFKSQDALLRKERLADGIIIATLDPMHLKPTLTALDKGYKILLEKPITLDLEGTLQIAKKAKNTGSKVLVAHVLRYTKFYKELKQLLDKKVIGKIRYVDHIENIGYYHFAHSFVRGNWRKTTVAAPIILAKSCHDMDLLYWLLGKKCLSLSSHASLEYFTAKNHPEGAGERCLDCAVEEECPYSASKIYLNNEQGWPVSVITTDLTYEGRYKALEDGPYGRCVFKCDNNVAEVQTVRMTCENNIEVSFALTAFSNEINRTSKFFGTKGEIRADLGNSLIKLYKFGKLEEIIKVKRELGGHGGGDTGLMKQFIKLLRGEAEKDGDTMIADSLESHLMAFAAEEARKSEQVIKLDDLRI